MGLLDQVRHVAPNVATRPKEQRNHGDDCRSLRGQLIDGSGEIRHRMLEIGKRDAALGPAELDLATDQRERRDPLRVARSMC